MEPEAATPNPQRLMSLDVFRGLTIAGMILVNNPGTWAHVYAPLRHAEWHGWTPTDLIFPFFLFIVGISMSFSFASRHRKGATSRELLVHTLYRSAIIFGIGLFLNGFPYFPLDRMRLFGVLQRIALCYVAAASIYLFVSRKTRAWTVAGLLLGYWALMSWVPVPGYGAGDLSAEGNLGAFIDRLLFEGHLWKPLWDPEGLLSTLPAIGTTLLGSFTGDWLRSDRAVAVKRRGMLIAGVVGLFAGWLWGLWFPINKAIWTSSYVIFTAGFALVLLALLHWLVDERGYQKWAQPSLVFGTNAIAAFTLSTFVAKIGYIWKIETATGEMVGSQQVIYRTLFEPLASPINASLIFALTYVLLWLLLLWPLYHKKIFIRI